MDWTQIACWILIIPLGVIMTLASLHNLWVLGQGVGLPKLLGSEAPLAGGIAGLLFAALCPEPALGALGLGAVLVEVLVCLGLALAGAWDWWRNAGQ